MMAEKYASVSPYNFSFNDPVGMNDPSGADPDYLETQYAYDGGYKGHRILYDDVYFGKDLGDPVINVGGSWQVMDPGNHITPGSGGNWSDNPVYSNDYWAFSPVSRDGNNLTINWNQTGSHGGSWDPNNGYREFESTNDALMYVVPRLLQNGGIEYTKPYRDVESEEESKQIVACKTCPNPQVGADMDYLRKNDPAFASLVDGILGVEGLTVGDAFDILKIANKRAKEIKALYLMNIFSPDNVTTILAIGIFGGPEGTETKAYSNMARYGGRIRGIMNSIRSYENAGNVTNLGLKDNQEVNMLIKNGNQEVKIRIETHRIGNEIRRHMNVELWENAKRIFNNHIFLN